MGKEQMRQLWGKDADAAVVLCYQRRALEPAEGFPVDEFFGNKPDCTEPDCGGVLLLPRQDKTFQLANHAYCLLCGRRYRVVGVEERRKLEGF